MLRLLLAIPEENFIQELLVLNLLSLNLWEMYQLQLIIHANKLLGVKLAFNEYLIVDCPSKSIIMDKSIFC